MGRASRIAVTLAVVLGCIGSAHAATIRGVVIAEDGTPAGGAKVWAVMVGSLRQLDRREVVADPAGRFAIAVDQASWLVAASWGDQGVAEYDLGLSIWDQQGDPAPVTIQLHAQSRLRVRLVATETGQPITGARVVFDNGLDPSTDTDGRLEVAGLSRSRHHEALVVAADRERMRVLFELSDRPTTDLDIAVPPGGKVVGRVLNINGQPIPGATVSPAISWGASPLQSFLWVRVDDQGRFEYDGLPVDRGTPLNGQAEGFITDTQNNLRPEPDGTPATVEFQLPPQAGMQARPAVRQPLVGRVVAQVRQAQTRVITGVVVDLKRQPIAATVRWTPQVETRTDAAGKFRLEGVPNQAGMLFFIPERADLAPEVTEIDQGPVDNVVVVLPPGRTTAGVVRDDRGVPFPGVTVTPRVNDVGLTLTERSTRTDTAGRFTVTGLPDSPSTFNFASAAMVPLNQQTLALDAVNTVNMTARGAILGKVVDAAGQPVRNFRVLFDPPHEAKAGDQAFQFTPGFNGVGLSFTAADGSFLIRNLNPGAIQRVTILASGYGEGTIDRVVAEPRNLWSEDRPVVFRLGPPRTLRVRTVASGTGQPIPNAWVALVHQPNLNTDYHWTSAGIGPTDMVRARTDASGVATFAPLSYAEARVLVRVPGFARRHVVWRDGAQDLVVSLTPEAVVDGAVLDSATGRAFEGAFVYLLSPINGQLDITPRFGDGGRFRFGEVPRGTYSLEVHNSTGALHQEQVELRDGEHLSRVINLTIRPPVVANQPHDRMLPALPAIPAPPIPDPAAAAAAAPAAVAAPPPPPPQ